MTELQTYQFETVTINLDSTNSTVNHEQKDSKYFSIDLGNNINLDMVYIPEGSFIMGSSEEEEGRNKDEAPLHEVKITPFFMSKYPITQAQYTIIMGNNPSFFPGENKPVENVSWFDCVEFCQKLSKLTKKQFRLPNEAEWEYSCRGGTVTPFYTGETINTDFANYQGKFAYGKGKSGICRQQTTDVDTFPPNPYGLYDLHGNVWEWCSDIWHNSYENAPSHNKSWENDDTEQIQPPRVLRGGSWDDTAYYCRSAIRLWMSPIVKGKLIGFRVVC